MRDPLDDSQPPDPFADLREADAMRVQADHLDVDGHRCDAETVREMADEVERGGGGDDGEGDGGGETPRQRL